MEPLLNNREDIVKNRAGLGAGFTLIEVVVAVGIFSIIASSIYLAYSNLVDVIIRNQWRTDAVSLLENEIEVVRTMPYEDVGLVGGYPVGELMPYKTVDVLGTVFVLRTTVRNIDDPFDGVAGGQPNDTAPADYKMVELSAECSSCSGFPTITMTTTVAPKNLETATNNGSLFINVFDSYGQPISGANVHVTNAGITPPLTLDDTTNISGMLQLIDIPTSTAAYRITVTKSGYSTEKTYPIGDPENPNPAKPHATVASQQVTGISFEIDKVSTVTLQTIDNFCAAVTGVDFLMEGQKLIGALPDVLKLSTTSATDANGTKVFSNVEWDTYTITNTDSQYALSGTTKLMPLKVDPNTAVSATWTMAPQNPSALLVVISDASSGQLLDDATVELQKTGYDRTLVAKRRSLTETDWSQNRFSAQSGGVETENPTGRLALKESGGVYSTTTQEWLESATIDFGTQSTSLFDISWQPAQQPPQTGQDSVRVQIATNNDYVTWNYVGPDGTAGSYFTAGGGTLHQSQSNNRYLRYKVFFSTASETATPVVEDVTLSFSSSCIPSGQAYFDGLGAGTYTITVQRSGYQTYQDTSLVIDGNWKEYGAMLSQ